MRLYFKTSAILLSSLFLSANLMDSEKGNNYMNVATAHADSKEEDEKFLGEYQFQKGYEEAIEQIKIHEGFANGKAYECVAGYKTIGYGHVVLPSDTFHSGTISRETADKLLRKDFDKAVRAVERETNLYGYKKIAIAHFVFAKGIGNFINSKLKELIEEGKPIDDELKKWCYYRNTRGEMVRSEWSYQIRLWEIEMYNRTD
jgi:lysozyme